MSNIFIRVALAPLNLLGMALMAVGYSLVFAGFLLNFNNCSSLSELFAKHPHPDDVFLGR